MAAIFQPRTRIYFIRRYYKLFWLLFAVSLFIIWGHLPQPPQTENNNRMNRPAPRHDIVTKPQFFHRSRFREHPDHDYEARVDDSLRKIEEKVRTGHQGSLEATGTVWQIMLAPDKKHIDRSPDSIAFELENRDWNYKGRLLETHPFNLATEFIKGVFNEVPEVAQTYDSYPNDVLRADFLRYLLLWYYGGYYSDMDVYPARPIKSCPALGPLFHSTSHGGSPNVSLILGIEIDEPYASPQLRHDWHWSRIYGFIQYTMYAPRRFSPVLRRAIVRVLSHTRQRSRSTYLSKPTYDEGSILETTGPGMFTDAVLDVLSESLPPNHPLVIASVEKHAEIGTTTGDPSSTPPLWDQGLVTWAPFHRLKHPLWVDASDSNPGEDMGGLGILPITVWGSGQRHSEAGWFNDVEACVNHRFGRTWKKGWWEYFFG